ncbi:MAG: type II toxin-antitoxin system HicB family antitoxin [Tannerellaceae bacterium]|nr:type II toxin-antitoxin system HicB family antitoxin [Tannerellaceae bacterium]
MEKINVQISWSGNNYCATASGERINGCVITTNKTLDGVKKDFKEAFEFHIEGSLHNGDSIPEWLSKGEYELYFEFDISALLHSLDRIVTRAAIARASGINERQLGHYASGFRSPRPPQREKIINAIHDIGRELILVV